MVSHAFHSRTSGFFPNSTALPSRFEHPTNVLKLKMQAHTHTHARRRVDAHPSLLRPSAGYAWEAFESADKRANPREGLT